jgi:hypothetical protein
MANNVRTFARSTGPRTVAIGIVSNPRRGPSVFWAKFTPPGTNMALLKKGLSVCAAECGIHAKNHVARMASAFVPNRRVPPDVTAGQ